MQSALRFQTTILLGGRIELSDLQLSAGEQVEIIVFRVPPQPSERRSALEILAEAPGHRLFKNAEEVDEYLREERDSWDD